MLWNRYRRKTTVKKEAVETVIDKNDAEIAHDNPFLADDQTDENYSWWRWYWFSWREFYYISIKLFYKKAMLVIAKLIILW